MIPFRSLEADLAGWEALETRTSLPWASFQVDKAQAKLDAWLAVVDDYLELWEEIAGDEKAHALAGISDYADVMQAILDDDRPDAEPTGPDAYDRIADFQQSRNNARETLDNSIAAKLAAFDLAHQQALENLVTDSGFTSTSPWHQQYADIVIAETEKLADKLDARQTRDEDVNAANTTYLNTVAAAGADRDRDRSSTSPTPTPWSPGDSWNIPNIPAPTGAPSGGSYSGPQTLNPNAEGGGASAGYGDRSGDAGVINFPGSVGGYGQTTTQPWLFTTPAIFGQFRDQKSKYGESGFDNEAWLLPGLEPFKGNTIGFGGGDVPELLLAEGPAVDILPMDEMSATMEPSDSGPVHDEAWHQKLEDYYGYLRTLENLENELLDPKNKHRASFLKDQIAMYEELIAMKERELGTLGKDLEYAELAKLAYSGRLSEEMQRAGWRIADPHGIIENDKTGYRSVTFKNILTGEVVVAFAGTNPLEPGDISTNIGNGLFGNSAHYEQAMDVIDAAIIQHGRVDHVVGHSLGGGIAASMALIKNIPATTFNGSGVHRWFVERNGGDMANADRLIFAYRNRGDALSWAQGVLWIMPDSNGLTRWLESNRWLQHGMEAMLEALRRAIEKGESP